MENQAAVIYGCEHYKRKCKLVTPCCQKIYPCRFCHDEASNDGHTLNRKSVEEIVCSVCETKQPIQQTCSNCGILFGQYFCADCRLIDDEDKFQFHCVQCGICRVGGRDKFFHCQTCDMCLPKKLENQHKCVEKMSRTNCPICLEDIHTSRIPSHIPSCGHLIHRTCFNSFIHRGHYACPVCQTSMMPMESYWRILDVEIQNTPMPPEYQNYFISILCNDCHKFSEVPMHPLGAKCQNPPCGSYNTCRSGGPFVNRSVGEQSPNTE